MSMNLARNNSDMFPCKIAHRSTIPVEITNMDLLSSSARDELYKGVLVCATQLMSEVEDVALEKESFREFCKYVDQIKILLQELHSKRVEAMSGTGMKTVLQTLEKDITKACNIMKRYKSGSRFGLLINYRSLLSQMQQSAKDIAQAIQLLHLATLHSTLELKSKAEEIIAGLESLEFRSAEATEAIISEIERYTIQNGSSQNHAMILLQQIAVATGTSPDATLVRSEIELLKKEIEELEARKQHAEVLQLMQLLHLLHTLEMESDSCHKRHTITSSENMIDSFRCPLGGELMEDPVAIVCGHSFERKSIIEHFERGERRCPICDEELASLELTQNLSLWSSINEWKQMNMHLKLQSTISGMNSDEPNVVDQALEDLRTLMEAPSCVAEVSRQGLIPKLVVLLKTNTENSMAALKCLCYLARYSKENKEDIAQEGAVRFIIKQFCSGQTEPEAVEILLELSKEESLAEHIGNTKDSIPSLVSLTQNPNTNINQKAATILDNLSSNMHLVIKMAKVGHFEPFLTRFHQGNKETKASMGAELATMQLSEKTARFFEDEQFIKSLTTMLYLNSPACKSSCLQCIKQLSAFDPLARLFLVDRNTIPALLGIMSSSISESHWKHEATEILISLVRASQPSNYQVNPSLHELHSQHNIHLFLQLVSISMPQTRALLLLLLLTLVHKSDIAQSLIQSDQAVMTCLFSMIEGDQCSEVRLHGMKLILCIAERHPDGIQLPPSPAKESIVTALAKIFTSSPNTEERSAAAGIISRLPSNDAAIDEMLHQSDTLKAIHEVISADDNRHLGLVNENTPATASHCLLENALSALLRYTQATQPELQRQISNFELYKPLTRVLSTGSSLARQRTALALAHLSELTQFTSNTTAITEEQINGFPPLLWLTSFLHGKSWCCSTSTVQHVLCSVHGSACSSRHTFCIIKGDALRPLIKILSDTESGASEAALVALNTILKDDRTITRAVAAIVESQGVPAILEVLERGSPASKEKALDLFRKILEHSTITQEELQRSKVILIHLLQFDILKKKVALVLSQMEVIPQQSSYF